MDIANWAQILDEAIYNSYSANTLGKGVRPTISSPAMDK